jgi:hypothetical protein
VSIASPTLSSSLPSASANARGAWLRWLGALLFGLELALLLLIASWLLRSCAPVDPALSVRAAQASAAAPAPALADPTAALKASLVSSVADGKRLEAEIAALQGDLEKRLEQCRHEAPTKSEPALPAERWSKGDLAVLKGCWILGRDVSMVHTFADGRKESILAKAGRICFGDDGTGMHEQDTVGPSGEWHCRAPITARFWANGTLTTAQPRVICEGAPPVQWAATTLACHRENDVMAICTATDHSGRTRVEFRREP